MYHPSFNIGIEEEYQVVNRMRELGVCHTVNEQQNGGQRAASAELADRAQWHGWRGYTCVRRHQ